MAEPVPSPITWGELQVVSSVVGIVVTGLGAIVAWLWRLVAGVRKELADHRVEVARDYVSKPEMNRIETNIINAVAEVGRRIDSFLLRKHD